MGAAELVVSCVVAVMQLRARQRSTGDTLGTNFDFEMPARLCKAANSVRPISKAPNALSPNF